MKNGTGDILSASKQLFVNYNGVAMGWEDAVTMSERSFVIAESSDTYEEYCAACGRAGIMPDPESEFREMKNPKWISPYEPSPADSMTKDAEDDGSGDGLIRWDCGEAAGDSDGSGDVSWGDGDGLKFSME